MKRRYFSFQYLPVNCTTGWVPRGDTWKTQKGANKAADRWAREMADEGCEVATRIVEIVNNVPVIVTGVPFARGN